MRVDLADAYLGGFSRVNAPTPCGFHADAHVRDISALGEKAQHRLVVSLLPAVDVTVDGSGGSEFLAQEHLVRPWCSVGHGTHAG